MVQRNLRSGVGPLQEPRGTHPISMTWPMYLRGECRVGFRTVHLSPNEASALCALLLRPGWLRMEELIEAIWPNPDYEPEWAEGSVVVYMCRLRAKGISVISRRTVGYMLGDRHRHA